MKFVLLKKNKNDLYYWLYGKWKTTIASELSNILKLPYLDTDEENSKQITQ